MEITKFIAYKKLSLRYKYYAFIDHEDNALDSLFIQEKITVNFLEEMRKKGVPWKIIYCKVLKKDAQRFEEAFDKAEKWFALKGYKGWPDMCKEVFG